MSLEYEDDVFTSGEYTHWDQAGYSKYTLTVPRMHPEEFKYECQRSSIDEYDNYFHSYHFKNGKLVVESDFSFGEVEEIEKKYSWKYEWEMMRKVAVYVYQVR